MPRIAAGVVAVALAMSSAPAFAATTLRLPAHVCTSPFALFADGLEGDTAIVRDASNGSGGAVGATTRVIAVPGIGNRSIHLHVPSQLDPARPAPLLVVLHGAAGSPAAADTAAQQLRTAWGAIGDDAGFITVAPVASGASGGWIAPPGVSDYDVIAAAIADVEARYNVDRSRRHAWGFSAGGHVLHDLMLGPYFPALTEQDFAGYAVAAGALDALACAGLSEPACGALLGGASRPIPLSLQVGTGDGLLPYVRDDRVRFLAAGWDEAATLRYVEFAGGHTYTAQQLAQTWQWLCPFQRLP
ncbi:alpha/beta hydrolase family esterase [Chiayiivirga flava]|uniref:Poly(3-hydroxybutyrate) depolymerase n=1 Tax=Chiayiivirga flava TaxID=659595 RepID=A0A7W8D5X1_9GAMM|nr:hypothetical protein [Chiayiivirga flava]MBB5208122.1 poly(3-hydroxybutyrate) depolymerase [Chiayiivirga flava]